MVDPNGPEAGAAFLAENKDKEGVITLASGLQYKILEEGPGMEHPTVSSPCECHYAGRLLDGSEFDSSYKRGSPTTFAPNQVGRCELTRAALDSRELLTSALNLLWVVRRSSRAGQKPCSSWSSETSGRCTYPWRWRMGPAASRPKSPAGPR